MKFRPSALTAALILAGVATPFASPHVAGSRHAVPCPGVNDSNAKATIFNQATFSCESSPLAGMLLHPTDIVASPASTSAYADFTTSRFAQPSGCQQQPGATDKIEPADGHALDHTAGETFCTLLGGTTVGVSGDTVKALTSKASVDFRFDSSGQPHVGVSQGTVSVNGHKVPANHQWGNGSITAYYPSTIAAPIFTELENGVLNANPSQLGAVLAATKQTTVELVGTDTQALTAEAKLLTAAGIKVTSAPASVTTNVQAIVPAFNQQSKLGARPAIVVVGSLPNAGSTFFQSLNALRTPGSGGFGTAKLTLPTQTQVFWIRTGGFAAGP